MTQTQPTAAELLQSAVTDPGIISAAYTAFHGYSMGNQILAWSQCQDRGIPLGPIATFPKWKELGRYVRKGEKAIVLCQPVTVKRKGEPAADGEPSDEACCTVFTYKPKWFVLAQTDGAELEPMAIPTWDRTRALETLQITETAFDCPDGNVQGYARGRTIAINPVNPMPWKTTFHECAHILLGHTAEGDQADGELTPRNLRECEAEAVALLCCAALELPGVDHCRGYIQGWYDTGQPIPDRSAQKILKAADQILKAGKPPCE
jgi:antirestriction protein ArdC